MQAEIHVLMETATQLLAEQKYPAAAAAFQEVLQKDPGYCRAYVSLGKALMHMELPEDAIAAFESALKLEKSAEVYGFIAQAYIELSDPLAAQAAASLGMALFPDDANLHFYTALGYNRRGSPALEQKHYRVAIRLNPEHVAALSNLGIMLSNLGRLAEARELFEQAYAVNPTSAAIITNCACVYRALGDDEALKAALAQLLVYGQGTPLEIKAKNLLDPNGGEHWTNVLEF